MRNFRALLILILPSFWAYSILGQTRQIDSLLNLYRNAVHDTTRCRLMLSIGDKYRLQSPDTAILWFNKAYSTASQAEGNNEIFTIYAAKALNLLGFVELDNRGNHQKTLEYSSKSLKLYETLLEKNLDKVTLKKVKKGYAACYRNMGYVSWFQGSYIKADEYLQKSLKIYDELGDKESMAVCYSNISIVQQSLNNFNKSLEYSLKALKINEETGNNKGIARCYSSIGVLQYDQKCYNKAIEYQLKALKIDEKVGNKKGVALCYQNLGNVYKEQGNLETANEYYQKALQYFDKVGDKVGISDCYLNIGTLYNEWRKNEKALEYFLKSLKISEELGYRGTIANCYTNISKLYVTLSDSASDIGVTVRNGYLEKAIDYGNKAYKLAMEKGIILHQNHAAICLQKAFTKSGRYKDAIKYAEIIIATQDSLFNKEKTKSLAEVEMKYEADKKQLQIDKLNKEKELQKRFNVSLFAGFIIILLFSGFLFRLFLQKKKANVLIAQKNQTLEMAYKEINSQKDEIERISGELHAIDEMKLNFFANLSHEFRTPLTLILNPAKNLLEKKHSSEEYNKQLGFIYSNALKLQDLTNQIMELQKLDAGKLQLNTESCDIINFCVSLVSSFESLCGKKNNMLKFRANHSSVTMMLDKDKVGKILINLISNALKFCYENTTVEIHIELKDHNFNMTIIDKGIGIPAIEIERVFKRYYQAPSSMQAGGTGIGLAYVKELVRFMNGDVTIDSAVDKGTTVKVTIPIEEYEIIDSANYEIVIPDYLEQTFEKESDIQKYENDNENSILIVEDNDELRVFIADLFKDDYVVYTARDGEEGIRAALDNIPNLIISDVMMPRKDGFELCTTLKSDERTSHIPIILLTAKDSDQSNLQGYQMGADDYIVKPFDSRLLSLKVKNIVATRQSIIKQFNFEANALPDESTFSDIDKNFMQKCIHLIETNMDNANFSVEQLAAGLAFSRRNLYRKIQSLTNSKPGELIRNIRMQHALKLFKATNLRVNEVALKVGYDNTVKFSQAFKKHHGVLPSEIKDNLN